MAAESPNAPDAPEQTVTGTTDANPAGASSTPAPNQQQTQDANQQAASSTATEGDKGPKTSLEAVRNALAADEKAAQATTLKEGEAAGASPGTQQGGSQDGLNGKGQPDPGKAKDDDRFDKHPRFIELHAKFKAAEGKAKQFDELSGWISSAGLEPKQLTPFLVAARLSVQDPEQALELVRRMASDLERVVGDVLPDDIRAKVESGQIDEDTAREMSRLRKRQERLQATNEARADAQAETQAVEARRQLGIAVGRAVTAWERQWQSSDPDYAKLQPFVWQQIRAYWVDDGGPPATPEKAVEQAKKALDDVRANLRSLLPARGPVSTVTGGAAPRTAAVPKTSLEAARLALGQGA